MEEMLLKIKSEKSADAIKAILEEMGIEVKLLTTQIDKPWMPGEPFTEEEMEERHQKSRDQIAAGNFYTLDEIKRSSKELFKKHGHDLHP